MATKDYTFLTTLLKNIDKRYYQYIDSLTEEQLKEVSIYSLLRWFSCVPDASGLSTYQLLTTTKLNEKYSNIDKKLMLKMICSAGIQRELRHQWISPVLKSNKNKKSKKWEKVKELLELNDIETDIIFKKYNDKQIIDLLKYYGLQDSEINKL